MNNLNFLLSNFSQFLNAAWPSVLKAQQLDGSETLLIDWLQSNWEHMVEALVGDSLVVLEVYGEGADCNPNSSRVLFPDRLPTHFVSCRPKVRNSLFDHLSRTDVEHDKNYFIFDRFVQIQANGWYEECQPFEQCLCYKLGREFVFNSSDILFEISPV